MGSIRFAEGKKLFGGGGRERHSKNKKKLKKIKKIEKLFQKCLTRRRYNGIMLKLSIDESVFLVALICR